MVCCKRQKFIRCIPKFGSFCIAASFIISRSRTSCSVILFFPGNTSTTWRWWSLRRPNEGYVPACTGPDISITHRSILKHPHGKWYMHIVCVYITPIPKSTYPAKTSIPRSLVWPPSPASRCFAQTYWNQKMNEILLKTKSCTTWKVWKPLNNVINTHQLHTKWCQGFFHEIGESQVSGTRILDHIIATSETPVGLVHGDGGGWFFYIAKWCLDQFG